MSIYLSDDRPRWQPTTEAELRSVIDAGLLQETHYLDAKREIGDSGGPRKETARDLASFAIDGGGLVIGVEENKEERTWTLAPQPLNGLAERVESIATHLVDPPLFVVTTDIPSESDPTQGYLYVYVPPSPRAPHMVDGIYFARGDRQRTRLSDAEVVRHHSRREPLEQLGHRLLDDEIARDHVPAEKQTLGHLYLVAQPLTPRHEMAREFVRGHPGDLINMLRDPERHLPPPVRGIVPSLAYLTSHRSRANGVSWCSSAAMGPGRSIVDEPGYDGEEGLLDVELREDGGVRLVAGRMTMQYGGSRLGAPTAVIVDSVAVAYSRLLAHWAAAMGERSSYYGSWVLGIAATRLAGLPSAAVLDGGLRFGTWPTWDQDDYREITTATHTELQQQPWAVASRLAGRMVRALGTAHRYGNALSPPSAP